MSTAAPAGTKPMQLICSEVWGGIERTRLAMEIPGLRGLVYAHPSGSCQGGDVYYVTACSAGLMARMCLADVVGHGEQVAQFSSWLHDTFRRHMNTPKPDRLLSVMNRLVHDRGLEVMSTAAVFTYYATDCRLHYGYAGHPHALWYRAANRRWESLVPPAPRDRTPRNMTFGVLDDVQYDIGSVRLGMGDRFIVYSDGLTEAMSPGGVPYGDDRLMGLLTGHGTGDHQMIGEAILADLRAHTGGAEPSQDDVTFMVFEVVNRMKGMKSYHFVRNRMRKALQR